MKIYIKQYFNQSSFVKFDRQCSISNIQMRCSLRYKFQMSHTFYETDVSNVLHNPFLFSNFKCFWGFKLIGSGIRCKTVIASWKSLYQIFINFICIYYHFRLFHLRNHFLLYLNQRFYHQAILHCIFP